MSNPFLRDLGKDRLPGAASTRHSQRKRAAGLCYKCDKPSGNRSLCDEHRKAHNAKIRARRAGRAQASFLSNVNWTEYLVCEQLRTKGSSNTSTYPTVLPKPGCWIWSGALRQDGYGVVKIHGKQIRAHRLIYQNLVGEIPEHLQVLHRCDVRRCVNPAHLFLGTDADNHRDKTAKGRHPKMQLKAMAAAGGVQ